jgi:hypothetical protein
MLLHHKPSSNSAIRGSGPLKPVPEHGSSTVFGLGTAIYESNSAIHNEEEKIKGEFVEYVKDILTKTTSQSNNNGGGNKQKMTKLSQMSMIEELTNQLRNTRDSKDKHKQITNINIPELLKQTAKKDSQTGLI